MSDQTAQDASPTTVAKVGSKVVAPYMLTEHGRVPFHAAQLPGLPAFLSGNPEEIVMTDKPKIVITWMHTNEDHAPTVAHDLYTKHPELAKHVNYICANPLTARTAPEKGFTFTDVNRSFGAETLKNPQVYEEHRAAHIVEFTENCDYVLDLHNTVCTNFGSALILKEEFLNKPRIRQIIAASPVKRILLMKADVADKCSVGDSHAHTVTLEYELSMTNSHAVPESLATIEALVTGNIPHQPFEREVFRMTGIIPKTEDPGLHVKNFEPFTDNNGNTRYASFLGTGPRSYREDKTKDYCGYYATMERIVL